MKKRYLSFVIVVCTAVILLILAVMFGPQQVICNQPYIRYGTGCCFDINSDLICDNDEKAKDVEIKITEKAVLPSSTDSDITSPEELQKELVYFPKNYSSENGAEEENDAEETVEMPEEEAVAPVIEEAAPAQPQPQIADAENTPLLCNDNFDNDGDSYIDGRDSQCIGVACDGGEWVWSGLVKYGYSVLPGQTSPYPRIGCVGGEQCVTLNGEGRDRDTLDTNQWICALDNTWMRCSEEEDTIIEDPRGGFICVEWRGEIQWTSATDLERNREGCADGIDNDGDGAVDGLDRGCKGTVCWSDETSWRLLIWSYLPGEDQNEPPPADASGRRRIQCCPPLSCATIDGQCVNQGELSPNSEKYVCAPSYPSNNWQRCDSSTVGQTSTYGNWQCTYSAKTYKWTQGSGK